MAKRLSIIAMDVHSEFCEGGYIDQHGNEQGAWRKPTSVPELLEAIGEVPGIRKLIIEEGPLADWLYRNLSSHVDEMIVCDPHRNALISKDGDKSDALDWRKLAALYRNGMIKAVHHQQSLARSLFKQRVQMYHERVSHRVSEAQKIIWRVRRLGVFIKEKDLAKDDLRQAMLGKIREAVALEDVRLLLEGYDQAAKQVIKTRSRLIAMARKEAIVKAFCDIPGIGWIRAATFFAFVDTPFRFKSKEKLWKYMGIGLDRRQSGSGRVVLRVPRRCSRPLKNVMLGAAKSAIVSGNNVFAEQHQRWTDNNCSPDVARRNVARSQAAVMWGMWKSGSEFDPQLVGRTLIQVH
jgi:transposase